MDPASADYIRRDRNKAIADRFVRRVRAAVRRLRQFPERGRFPPELFPSQRDRELIDGDHRIVYLLPDKRTIEILAVVDGRMPFPKL